jgi:hypothetical protein
MDELKDRITTVEELIDVMVEELVLERERQVVGTARYGIRQADEPGVGAVIVGRVGQDVPFSACLAPELGRRLIEAWPTSPCEGRARVGALTVVACAADEDRAARAAMWARDLHEARSAARSRVEALRKEAAQEFGAELALLWMDGWRPGADLRSPDDMVSAGARWLRLARDRLAEDVRRWRRLQRCARP